MSMHPSGSGRIIHRQGAVQIYKGTRINNGWFHSLFNDIDYEKCWNSHVQLIVATHG